MQQLSSMDLLFLRLENATHVGHVAGVSVLDPAGAAGGVLTLGAVRELVGSRLHLVPALRRRLVEVPLDLDRPYWAEDAGFDLDFHLRELALAPPGDERTLAEQVARLHARPLDRSRPLWELYLVHGLAGGRQALYGKVHHAAFDGVSGGEILGVLMDRTASPREVEPPAQPWRGETPPGRPALLGRGLRAAVRHPAGAVLALPRLLPHLDGVPGAAQLPGAGTVAAAAGRAARFLHRGGDPPDLPPPRPTLPVPRTPFNGPITAHRRVAFASLPLADVRAVRNAAGCTENDVVLALCTTVLRRWLLAHRALPDIPLVAGIPVSLRRPTTAEASGGAQPHGNQTHGNQPHGNQLSLMVAPLPTHLADPASRLAEIASAMFAAKRRFSAMPEGWLEGLTDLIPPALAGLASRAVFKLANAGATTPLNLMVSNVPGPPVPLYTAGARIVAHYPVSAVSDAFGGLNITVVRYARNLDFGLVACREMVPDLWDMAAHLPDALAELKP